MLMETHESKGHEDMARRSTARIAVLSAFAVVLHAVEALIPAPLPWLRFGFANIITLVGLSLYGFRAGMTITIIRVFVGGFWRGTLLGPPFILSLGGGLVSTIAMWTAMFGFRHILSPIGVSLLGAIAHNITQLLLAQVLFIKNREVLIALTPVILGIGTVTGSINGFASLLILSRLSENNRSPL